MHSTQQTDLFLTPMHQSQVINARIFSLKQKYNFPYVHWHHKVKSLQYYVHQTQHYNSIYYQKSSHNKWYDVYKPLLSYLPHTHLPDDAHQYDNYYHN